MSISSQEIEEITEIVTRKINQKVDVPGISEQEEQVFLQTIVVLAVIAFVHFLAYVVSIVF
jgi:hypothetical protein